MKNAMEDKYTHFVQERTAETDGVAASDSGSNGYIAQIGFRRILFSTRAPAGGRDRLAVRASISCVTLRGSLRRKRKHIGWASLAAIGAVPARDLPFRNQAHSE